MGKGNSEGSLGTRKGFRSQGHLSWVVMICRSLKGNNGKRTPYSCWCCVAMTLDYHLLYSALYHLSSQRVPLDRLAVGTEALWVPGPALCLHEAWWWHLQLVPGPPAPQEGVCWHHTALIGASDHHTPSSILKPKPFLLPCGALAITIRLITASQWKVPSGWSG